MSVSINPPKTPVTKGSQGVASITMPNVCKMPGPPAPFVLTALPNVGRSGASPKGYTKKVKVGGQPVAIRGASFKSKGDAASKGTGGGLVSANTHGPTTFAGPGSRNVKFEGKNVQLLGDPMLNNCNPAGRMPNSATMVGLIQKSGLAALVGDEVCPLCKKEHGDAGKLEETVNTQGDADLFAEAAKRAVDKAAIAREQRLVGMQRENQIAAEQKYQTTKSRVEVDLAKARFKANAAQVKSLQEQLDTVKIEVKEARLSPVELAAMLGVVRCKDGKVYAAASSCQRKEVVEETPNGWHMPICDATLFPSQSRTRPDWLKDFQQYASDPAIFAEQWQIASQRAKQYSDNARDDPYHPPGQCAAPRAVALALEHGGRPVGLTERWYNSKNPNGTVTAMVRDSVTAQPRLGEFGGKTAVPPCGTCEVLLTMLICPEHIGPECQHRAPAKGVCRCT